MSGPALSVVIPTRDREAILRRTLDALAAVRGAGRMEILVVPDEGRGPAFARNRGVERARGGLVAFLGDDTLPVEGWLDAHLAAHAARPGHAVVGDVRWHPEAGGGPFLEFLSPRGPQFDFGDLADPSDLGPERFFTANLSLPRALAVEVRFDERFPAAAGEDVEWGWRLHDRGVKVAFARDAAVLHLHRHDLASFERRMVEAGRAARLLGEIRPVLRDRLSPRRPALQRVAGALLRRVPAPDRLRWRAVLGAAWCRGYAEGIARA